MNGLLDLAKTMVMYSEAEIIELAPLWRQKRLDQAVRVVEHQALSFRTMPPSSQLRQYGKIDRWTERRIKDAFQVLVTKKPAS